WHSGHSKIRVMGEDKCGMVIRGMTGRYSFVTAPYQRIVCQCQKRPDLATAALVGWFERNQLAGSRSDGDGRTRGRRETGVLTRSIRARAFPRRAWERKKHERGMRGPVPATPPY